MKISQINIEVYERLADALDRLPIGFAHTKSRVELQILERLFSPEEAKVASHMTGTSEAVETIAQRAGLPKEEVQEKLTAMLSRRMIWSSVKDSVRTYRLTPYMVGFYEQQSETMDHDLAHLFEHYWMEGGGNGIMKYHPDTHRVDPAHAALDKTEVILPYNDVRKLMSQAKSFQVRNCICRRQQELLGAKKCEFPVRNCISFFPVELPQSPNTITKEEAMKLLDEAEEIGLVHCVANQQSGLYWVCNCCGCCCGILRGILELGIQNTSVRANYYAVADPDQCKSCGTCEDRCHVNAVSVNGTAIVDRAKCIGCGICVTGCPNEAMSLRLRSDAEMVVPPENYKVWEQARLRNRGLSQLRKEHTNQVHQIFVLLEHQASPTAMGEAYLVEPNLKKKSAIKAAPFVNFFCRYPQTRTPLPSGQSPLLNFTSNRSIPKVSALKIESLWSSPILLPHASYRWDTHFGTVIANMRTANSPGHIHCRPVVLHAAAMPLE